MLSFNYAQSDGNYSLKIAVTRETLFLAGEAVLLAPEFGAGRRDFQIQPKTVEQALRFAGRFDLTGILTNGDMRVYTTLATGALWGTGQKIGNGWAFRQVSSPGDFNKDGFPDVIAQDGSGNILTYPVLGGGRWGGYVRTGTGFGGYRLIG